MTPSTKTAAGTTGLRTSQLDRPTAMRLAATEYTRCATVIAALTDAQWALPTQCPGWDVRALGGHVLGMAEMAASVREGARQRKAAMRSGGVFIDALTDQQVRKHAPDTASELVDRFERIGPVRPEAGAARRASSGAVRCP